MGKKVAVVLSGCGHRDGAEIREAVCTILALDRAGCEISFFAPDKNQTKVVNHITGEEVSETRNILVEAARIARGQIKPLAQAKAADFDGVAFPGGFGAALNLSNFAVKGAEAEADPDVKRLVKECTDLGKPICAICIAPAMLATALKGTGIQAELTVGAESGAAQGVNALGAKHVVADVDQAVIDSKNKITSAPAYMYGEASISQVADGIDKAVAGFVKML